MKRQLKYTKTYRPRKRGRDNEEVYDKYGNVVAIRNTPPREFVPRTMGPQVSESKYFDGEVSNFNVAENTAWGATNDVIKGIICVPQEGSAVNNRVGRKIELYKIAIRGVIESTTQDGQASALEASAFRVMLWQDKQANGAVTTSASLMQDSTAATTVLQFCSFQNPENFGRFRVLKDKILYPRDYTGFNDAANTGSVTTAQIPFKITHKFAKEVPIKFAASNGAIGDIVDNAFYLSIQKGTGVGVHVVSVRTRAYYKDR